jgi:hypothetical protein
MKSPTLRRKTLKKMGCSPSGGRSGLIPTQH